MLAIGPGSPVVANDGSWRSYVISAASTISASAPNTHSAPSRNERTTVDANPIPSRASALLAKSIHPNQVHKKSFVNH